MEALAAIGFQRYVQLRINYLLMMNEKNKSTNDKIALFAEILLYLIFFLMASLWCGGAENQLGMFGGGVAVVMLWVYTFNQLPTLGLKCVKHPRAIFFQIPVSVLASVAFFVGVCCT